jgi:hypothetical protein
MRPHQRRAIRKAEKLSIRIKDDLDLSHFLELNRKTFTRQGKHPLGSDELIGRLDSACRTHAGRKIFAGIDSQGRVHAAVYVAWANDTAYYLMGGSEPDLRASGAQLLLCGKRLFLRVRLSGGSTSKDRCYRRSNMCSAASARNSFPTFRSPKCPLRPNP